MNFIIDWGRLSSHGPRSGRRNLHACLQTYLAERRGTFSTGSLSLWSPLLETCQICPSYEFEGCQGKTMAMLEGGLSTVGLVHQGEKHDAEHGGLRQHKKCRHVIFG